MKHARKAFRRGYRFASFRGTASSVCTNVSPGADVSVPLKQGYGEPAQPVVKTGDSVRSGTVIAESAGAGNPIHAPITGSIVRVGKGTISIAVEESGAAEEFVPISGATSDWGELDATALRKLLYLSGVAGIDIDGIPTEHSSSAISPDEVTSLIVKIVPDDLLNPDPEAIVGNGKFGSFTRGLHIVAKAFPGKRLTVAVADSLKNLATRIENGVTDPNIDVALVASKYPQSNDVVLVKTVTGTEYPYGFRPIHLGVVVLEYQTLLHADEAVSSGKPVISRRLVIAGPSVTEPNHIEVPIGTPITRILSERVVDEPSRVVIDSLMTGGAATDDGVISRSTRGIYCVPEARRVEPLGFASPGFTKDSISNTFLSKLLPVKKELNTNLHGERRACLNCSFCVEVCPVGIMPNILHRYVERDMVDENLPPLGILKCIDCNLCTYVCPSKIPLAKIVAEGKSRLIDEGYVNLEDTAAGFTLKGIG